MIEFKKIFREPPQADLLRISKDEVIRDLAGRLFPVVAAFGLILGILSVVQTMRYGWYPSYSLDVFLYLIAVAVLGFHKKLSTRLVASLIMLLVAIDGLLTLLASGIAGPFIISFTALAMFAGIFFGLRASIAALAFSVIAILVVGGLNVVGILDVSNYVKHAIRSPVVWVARASTILFYLSTFIVIINAIQCRLSASLRQLAERERELERSIERLKTEIASREKAEAALRAEEQKYRALVENMQDTVFVQNMDFSIRYVNSAVYTMFGFTPEEALKTDISTRLTPQSWSRAISAFQHYAELARLGFKPAIPLKEFEYIRKNGSIFWGELRAAFLFDEKGNPVGALGIIRDVTERKKAEEERRELEQRLRQAEKLEALGLLAGGIAHDFNNRLAGILGNAEYLRAKCTDRREIQCALSGIIEAVRSLADVVSKLLTFARNTPASFAPVDMHSLINDVETILEHSIPKSISIVKCFNAPQYVIAGDRVLLQNCLLNLAINSRDAMPNGGELRFETDTISIVHTTEPAHSVDLPAGEYLRLQVIDTGSGIDPAVLRRLYQPFVTTKEKGTGLGLSMVYGAVKSHRGGIDVKSELGKGTTFIIYLPLSDLSEMKKPEPKLCAKPEEKRERNGMHIIVIEDEEIVAMMTVRLLEMLGHQVRRFRDGKEAVESLSANPVECDLILLDMTMPRLNGKETFKAIHAMLPAVPVIIMSGYSDGEDVRAVLKAGAIGFLQKPFTAQALKEKVETASREANISLGAPQNTGKD